MKLIAVFTHSGFTARLSPVIARSFPSSHFLPKPQPGAACRFTGVSLRATFRHKKNRRPRDLAEKRLLEERLVKKGDVIGIVAGTPMGIRGTTNFMKFHVIGGL